MTHSEVKTREDRRKLSEQNKLAQEKIKSKNGYQNEENNPCFKEQQLSYKCMNDTNYEDKACVEFFENYKACKSFWYDVERKRRIQGIHPTLPPLEERAKIKAQFLKGNSA